MEEEDSSLLTKSYRVHPLVIFNICDHLSRYQYEEKHILGIIIGCETGLSVHLCDSYEIDLPSRAVPIFDMEYIMEKEKQVQRIYPEYSVLGWYAVRKEIETYDLDLHHQLMKLHENPCFLLFEPDSKRNEIPIEIYETKIQLINGTTKASFVNVLYKQEMNDIERIALDHTAKTTFIGTNKTKSSPFLNTFSRSVGILKDHIEIVLQFLKAIQEGRIPNDQQLLQKINLICMMITSTPTTTLQEVLQLEQEETLMITHLATIAKGLSSVRQVAKTYSSMKYTRDH